MSIPTAVFLDTSVLDSQQYNFQSTALSTFVPACAKRGVKLLLPDPTEREVKRHLRERAAETMNTVEAARRKAPFLAKFRGLERQPARLVRELVTPLTEGPLVLPCDLLHRIQATTDMLVEHREREALGSVERHES